MAVQGRGYYGIGAVKKDFGFSKNMTLPLNHQYEWPTTDGTPMEGGSKRKGRANFAEDQDDGRKSWKKRFSSLFKKKKKRERQEALNQMTTGVASGYRTEQTLEDQLQPVRNADPADDVNDRILMQEGLMEEQSESSEIDDEAVLGEGETDSAASMVVAEEVEVVYHEDDDNSLGGGHAEEDINVVEDEDEPQTTVEVEADLHNEEGHSDQATPPEEPLEDKELGNDQVESKPRGRTSSKSKKNGKATKRKSAALESTLQDEETVERKKAKKKRPKSMPPQSIQLTEDQDDKPLVESPKAEKERTEIKQPVEDTAAQVASTKKKKRPKQVDTSTSEGKEVEMEQEVKKTKVKRAKEKRTSSISDTGEKEGLREVVESASPPPEEEIRVPKQVTVGVIKKKKKKTRPFLDVSHEGEEGIDTEERELIHDMDTLQLIAEGAAAKTNDKKVKKKRQSKAYVAQEQEPDHEQPSSETTKQAKKSKRRSTAESKAEGLEETKEVVKVSKKVVKSKEEAEVEAAVAPPELETATEEHAKRKKKAKKMKSREKSEPEAEAVTPPPPQLEGAKEAKKKKTTKKGKNKQGEASPLIQPEPEVMVEPDKKPAKKVKKSKSSEKSSLAPVTSPAEPKDTPEASKKKASKKSKGKSKAVEDVDAPSPLVEANDKAKKKKRKSSKASLASQDSSLFHEQKQTPSGSASARTSRSLLGSRSSKSKIASEESDDLVWIGSEKLPKRKRSRAESKDDTAVDEAESTELSPSSRSTSYHELSKEARKTFQEEFRKASSQQSVDDSATKVDIDPNVKVTKSGVVKGGKGSRRPSIQVFEGGGIDHTDNASPSEDASGSEGRDKKISMDLAAVPQTTPSLGLTHGHDKLDLVNRSASKRRPMSFSHKDSTQEEAKSVDSPPQNHILAAHISRLNRLSAGSNGSSPQDSASMVYKAKNRQSAPIARQLFPSGETQNGEGSATSTLERSKRNKSVDKPVKTLGIASENSPSASPSSVPAWVAMAKNKQKRSSQLLVDKDDKKPAAAAMTSPSMTSSPPAAAAAHTTTTTTAAAGGSGLVGGSRARSTDSTIPKMGTVQARLAAFERK